MPGGMTPTTVKGFASSVIFLSDDGRVSAEASPPEAVAKDDLLSVAGQLGVPVELAAQLWMQAENTEDKPEVTLESVEADGFCRSFRRAAYLHG